MSDSQFILLGPPDLGGPYNLSFSEIVFNQVKQGGDAIAQISNATGEKVTYKEILQKSVNLAVQLKKLGVKRGDVVALSSENRFEFTVSTLAILFNGAVTAPLNVLYSRIELIHGMKISKPKIVICSPFTVYNVLDVEESIPSIEKILTFGDDQPTPSILLYDDLVKIHADVETFRCQDVDVKNDGVVILCSSGTTGLPKGVFLTHYNFSMCRGHLIDMMREVMKVKDTCLLTLLPWFHAYGFITHLMCLAMHLKYVFMVKFEDEAFLSALQNYKVTITFLVPPLMVFLAKHPLVDKFDLSSLQEIWCGAAPLSRELQMEVTRRIRVPRIMQGYGMTEMTLAVLHNGQCDVKYGSCGRLVPGIQAKVVDLETGEALGPHKRGELCFRGGVLMKGYLGDAAATNHIFDSEGWLHTGDIGYYDSDKFFYIVDRLKELIKYKAFQVPPAELEALLLQHPGIRDVGVVGLPDPVAGELPLAFVVLQPGARLSEEQIQQFVASKVSVPKRLHGGVRFLQEIPKNPSGKILRRELRELLNKIPASKV